MLQETVDVSFDLDGSYECDSPNTNYQEISLKTRLNVQDADCIVDELERRTRTKFVVVQKMKHYGNPGWKPKSSMNVYWEHPKSNGAIYIPYDGQPFMFIGKKVMGCHQGPDKGLAQKKRYSEKRDKLMETGSDIKRRKVSSKKKNCPAKVITWQIAKFPAYRIKTNSVYERRKAATALRKNLKNNADVLYHMLFVTAEPDDADHSGHPVYDEQYFAKYQNVSRRPKVAQMSLQTVMDEWEKDRVDLEEQIEAESRKRTLVAECAKVTTNIHDSLHDIHDHVFLDQLLVELRHLQYCIKVQCEHDGETEDTDESRSQTRKIKPVTVELMHE